MSSVAPQSFEDDKDPVHSLVPAGLVKEINIYPFIYPSLKNHWLCIIVDLGSSVILELNFL